MEDTSAVLFGSLDKWPSKDEMAEILKNAGLKISVGKYSITINDCSHFRFQEYDGDLNEPCIETDADNTEEMIKDAKLVSNALKKAELSHSFEIYDHNEELAEKIKYEKNT